MVINPLKEFIELKVNTDTMIKNVKLAEVNTKIANAVLKTQILKVIYIVTKIIKKKKNWWNFKETIF